MADYADRRPSVARRRFAIAADGSITDGQETPDRLVAALRYSCRMAAQIETLLDVGTLKWLTTLSGTAVTARVGQGSGGDVTLNAEVEERASRTPHDRTTVGAKGTQTAIRQCLKLVRDGLDADWCAVITAEKRVVGALLPDARSDSDGVAEVLIDVGIRALAVLGALDESYRETAVLLEYRQGSLMVVAVEGDVLYAFADKFDHVIATRIIDDVRAVLAPHNMALAWTWGTGRTS